MYLILIVIARTAQSDSEGGEYRSVKMSLCGKSTIVFVRCTERVCLLEAYVWHTFVQCTPVDWYLWCRHVVRLYTLHTLLTRSSTCLVTPSTTCCSLFIYSLLVTLSTCGFSRRSKGKGVIALYGNPSQSYGASPAIWDHSITCHPTKVNAPRLNPSHAGRYSNYLPRRDGRLS